MSNVVDLSELKNKKAAAEAPKAQDLTDEQLADLDALIEKNDIEDEGQEVRTAFLVLVGEDGHALATADLDMKVKRQYLPTIHDLYGAAAQIQKDIAVANTSETTSMMLPQVLDHVARQKFQEAEAAKLAATLNLPRG